VANQFRQDWLRNHFRKDLEAVCLETVGMPLTLEFRIDDGILAKPHTSPVHRPKIATNSSRENRAHEPAPESPVRPSGEAPEGAPRGRRPFASLHTFIGGESNCVAVKSAEMLIEQPGSFSPLLIYGPTGVGKTHLLEGIWSAYRKKHRHSTVLYLSAEQFTSYFLEALRGSGLPSFRRKYRDVDLLIIDDIQFFSGKRATLVELQNTIDALLRSGRQLVLAADRSPAALKSLGPELMARLSGGMVCRIEPPEYQTRVNIVKQLAVQLGVQIPEDVQTFIASRLTSHARELAGAVKRLQATSLAHGRPISLSMAEEALSDLVHHGNSAVKIADIEKAVCEVFGLERESLQSTRKSKTVSHPRMLAMFLARKHTRAALSEIGNYFGQRTHSTVIAANNKIENWMSKGRGLDLAGRNWSLDEAIRRVEENLRAG
jgi:chromosomal replication initiator protein